MADTDYSQDDSLGNSIGARLLRMRGIRPFADDDDIGAPDSGATPSTTTPQPKQTSAAAADAAAQAPPSSSGSSQGGRSFGQRVVSAYHKDSSGLMVPNTDDSESGGSGLPPGTKIVTNDGRTL